eukprot:6882127-Alexandrium_andersonii.AAC.1
MLGQELSGTLIQPEHGLAAHRYPPLGSLLEGRHQGANPTIELLGRIPHGPIGSPSAACWLAAPLALASA